jgi:pimeloyl-ACP methyl ester carboxylesterase
MLQIQDSKHMYGLIVIALLITALLAFVGLSQAQEDEHTTVTVADLADENGDFVTIADEIELYYVSAGDPTDPAVILIHGFGGSTVTWRDTLPALADAGYYTLALDLPPFGLSDKSTDIDYTRSAMARYVTQFMDALEIDTATIVGHSMGGSVTAHIAAQHPDRVDQLVFVAGAVYSREADAPFSPEQDDDDGTDPLMSLLQSIDPDIPFAANVLRALLTPERFTDILTSAYANQEVVTADVVNAYARPLQTEDWAQGFLAYIGADETNPVALEDITIDVPILVMWGEADTWVPLTIGETIIETLDQAEIVTYAGIGHLPMEEAPQAFNQDLIAFLRND